MRKKSFILENGLHFSFVVALVATLGSLYFSEVKGYMPCNLCWYQRIMMYPQVILLGIAAVRKDVQLAVYILPISVIGACISTYHYLMEKTSFIHESTSVCGPVPCNAEYINWLGFITIPFLALIAFILIAILQIAILKASRTTSMYR